MHLLQGSDDALTSATDLESHVQVQCSGICNRNRHTAILLVPCQFGADLSRDPPQRPLVNGRINMLTAVQLQIKFCAGGSSPQSSTKCLQAAFLLPWRRIFNLSDSQLSVAKRENAKALFRGHIESKGGMLQVCTRPTQIGALQSACLVRGRCTPRMHVLL